jgi:hypothetical protein
MHKKLKIIYKNGMIIFKIIKKVIDYRNKSDNILAVNSNDFFGYLHWLAFLCELNDFLAE